MDYKTVFRDAFRLFRESKLFWIFGAIAVVSEFLYRVSIYSIGKHPIYCIPYPVLLLGIYFSLFAKAVIIYSTIQAVSRQTPTFSEVWHFCKAKMNGFVGFYLISIPLLIFSALIFDVVTWVGINPPFTWVIGVLVSFFLTSLITVSICIMTLHNLEARSALWMGIQIVFKNFLHLIVLNGIFLILAILLMGSTGNVFLELSVSVPLTISLALVYQVFITKGSYPALSNIHPTA